MYQQEGELSWPTGMVDECDMDIDIDITAEVQCDFFLGRHRSACTCYHDNGAQESKEA